MKTTSRDGRLELLGRSIQLLYPLELKCSSDGHETSDKADSSPAIVNPSEKPPPDKEYCNNIVPANCSLGSKR